MNYIMIGIVRYLDPSFLKLSFKIINMDSLEISPKIMEDLMLLSQMFYVGCYLILSFI